MVLSTFYGSFRRIMDEVSSNYTLFSRKNFFSKKVALYCDFLCHTTFTSLVCCQHRVLELFSIFLHKKHCISMEIALWSGVNGTKSFKNCSEKCTSKNVWCIPRGMNHISMIKNSIHVEITWMSWVKYSIILCENMKLWII